MRLLCNFVNVYTRAYRVQYTFARVHACIPYGHPREEKRASDKSEDKSARIVVHACPARGELHGEVAILARKSARMSVSVPWNSSVTAPREQFIHP